MTDLTFAHLVDIEEKLKLLEFCVDNIGEAVYWLTMDFRFRNVNAAACRMLGYSRDELLSLSLHDIDPDYSHVSMQSDLELLKRAGTLSLRGSHTARDGRIIPVEITPSYFIYCDVEYICCIVRDITERVKTEEALRMSQFIIDKASFGILRGQADAKILFANEYGARMLGYTQDELCSMTFFDIDPSLTRAFWQEHRKKVTATGSNTFESVHRRKDGTIYPVEVIVNYQEFQGQEFSCSFFRDITERKRAEEALLFSHFCINKAGIGIYHCDEHGTIFSVNDYACASLGYSKDELCALSVFEIDPVITPERMLEIKKILDTSGAATHETIHRRRDGTTFPVEITINVLEFLGRTFSISFVKDITERKRVEEELLLTQFCVDKASIALYQLTEEGEIWNVNECACQSLGYSIEELRSMTVFDIDPAATREVFNDLAIRTFSCGSVTFERMHRRKDGITFPVEITANSLEFRGRRFAICFVKDITDRKRVEESLRKAHDDLESRVRERTGQLSSLTPSCPLRKNGSGAALPPNSTTRSGKPLS